MIKLNSKDFDFGNPNISEMTVLGHAVYVKKIDSIKRKSAASPVFDFTLNLKDRYGSLDTAKKKGIQPFVIELMDNIVPNTDNCGDGEQGYIYALRSHDESLRMLLALNGQYLEVLSEDNSRRVRRAVLRYVTYLEKRDEHTGDLSWIDSMVGDQCEFVRRQIAKIGIKEHLDVLINDSSRMVLEMVARKGTTEHITIMLNDSDMDFVRSHLAFNPNATDEQLALMAKDASYDVLLRLAERGYAADEVVSSKYPEVRLQLAKNCAISALDLLIDDPDALVRIEIAWRGVALELLQYDDDEKVREAVTKYRESVFENTQQP